MSDSASAILDAAERRIRKAGYNGFSFREIAADVGVKSSSVHYHFPTKERLAAAVARRYTDRFTAAVYEDVKAGIDPAEAWHRAFKNALRDDGGMCLCGSLGASAKDLPDEVLVEVQRFFKQGLAILERSGLSHQAAAALLASLEGAMLIATTLRDESVFDAATLVSPAGRQAPPASVASVTTAQ
jgi:TetR/AcrR family transcriptional repressor of nem operon